MYKILAEIIMDTFTKNARDQLEEIKGKKGRNKRRKKERGRARGSYKGRGGEGREEEGGKFS